MIDVYLGLGSNITNRASHIQKAITLLGKEKKLEIVSVSRIIETEALTKQPQPKYLNGAMHIRTTLNPAQLLAVTVIIEKKLGRVSKGNYDPRTIDLDILLYGQNIICEDKLIIPHPLLHEREFVLIPLFEIAPDFIHPVLGETIASIYNRVVGY